MDNGEKLLTIYVNGEEHQVPKGKISHEAVVLLAFPDAAEHPEINYTVKYKPNEHAEASHILPPGDKVEVHQGMVFSVRDAGQS